MPPETTRKVFFYKAEFRHPNMETDLLEPVDPLPAFQHAQGLPFAREGVDESRYLRLLDGNDVFVIMDHAGPRIRGRILIGRRTNLPDVEAAGRFHPLGLGPEEGLAEASHFVLFPEGVLGMEYNFYAPRASRLAQYLMAKADDYCRHVQFEPYIRGDVEEQLRRIGPISEMTIRVHRDQVSVARELDESLERAFDGLRNSSTAVKLGIHVAREGRKDFLQVPWWQRVGGWLRRRDVRESVDTFLVRAVNRETDRVEPFDLLQDKLVSAKRVLKVDERSRTIVSESMYTAILEAFQELRPHLVEGGR